MRTRWLVGTVAVAFAIVGVLQVVGRGSQLAAEGEAVFNLRSAPLGAPGPVRVEPGTALAAPVTWDGRNWSATLSVAGEPDAVLEAYHRQLAEQWPRSHSRVPTEPVPVGPITTRQVADGLIHRFSTVNEGTYFEDDSYTFELIERRGRAVLHVHAGHRE